MTKYITKEIEIGTRLLTDAEKATLRDILDPQVEEHFPRSPRGLLPSYTIHVKIKVKD